MTATGSCRVGTLRLIVTVHVDDFGLAGEVYWMDWLEWMMSQRYGAVTPQVWDYLHIGHHYRQDKSTYDIITDLQHFIDKVEEPYVPSNLELPMDAEQISDTRAVHGSLQYALAERPDKAGRVAANQQRLVEGAKTRVLSEAVKILREMKVRNREISISYPCLAGAKFRLTLPGDSSLRNVDSKYAQQGYLVLLEDASSEVGGLALLLDHATKKSPRVAPSSFRAETLIMVTTAELSQKLKAWWTEVIEGTESVKDLAFQESAIKSRLWTDCYDLFTALRCPRPYSGKDPASHLYIEGLKEDMRLGHVDEVGWCPTECMLPDSLTKDMYDKLVLQFMHESRWNPTGYELFRREDMPEALGTPAAVAPADYDRIGGDGFYVFLAQQAADVQFWTCSPSCSNCIVAISLQLQAQHLLQRRGCLGDFFERRDFPDPVAAHVRGTTTTTSRRTGTTSEHGDDTEETVVLFEKGKKRRVTRATGSSVRGADQSYLVMPTAPSLAQISLVGIYVSLLFP
jgi:hypothetical protein